MSSFFLDVKPDIIWTAGAVCVLLGPTLVILAEGEGLN